MNNEVVSNLGAKAFAEPATAAVSSLAPRPVIEIDNLHVQFVTSHGTVRAVEGLSYSVYPGEMVAIVGESGSGKSVSALAVMRLLPAGTARIPEGSIRFNGKELLEFSEEEMRQVRGREIAMIFQEPMTSLNPVLRIGLQIMEPLIIHLKMDNTAARARAIELLTLVGITDPESRLAQYPHQLSGGMRQRVMIAIGLACNPKLLIADEPTTALDVTIQAQILELMKDLSRRLGVAVVIITHNLGIVARYADRVNVMYAARLVESGTAETVFGRALHPYARGLLSAVPRLDRGRNAKLATIDGAPPNLQNPPQGCRFRPRCRFAIAKCEEVPPLEAAERGHLVACFRKHEIEALDPPGVRADSSQKLASIGDIHVLVVDDNKQMRLLLRCLLRAGGVTDVSEAQSAADAFQIMSCRPADLIIVDWMMQPVDGLTFTRMVRWEAKSTNPYVPLLMLTAHTETSRVAAARDAGVHGFVKKPISARVLFDRMASALTDTRMFIKTDSFMGPDRRRNVAADYAGPFRRADDRGAATLDTIDLDDVRWRA